MLRRIADSMSRLLGRYARYRAAAAQSANEAPDDLGYGRDVTSWDTTRAPIVQGGDLDPRSPWARRVAFPVFTTASATPAHLYTFCDGFCETLSNCACASTFLVCGRRSLIVCSLGGVGTTDIRILGLGSCYTSSYCTGLQSTAESNKAAARSQEC